MGLRVELMPDQDPKVYDNDSGEEVTNRCRTITIHPGRYADAVLFKLDSDGKKRFDEARDPVVEAVPVVRIAGVWKR